MTEAAEQAHAEANYLPLLVRPLAPMTYGHDVARRILRYANPPAGSALVEGMKDYWRGCVHAAGTDLYEWLRWQAGLWPEGRDIPLDHDAFVQLAREVTGGDGT